MGYRGGNLDLFWIIPGILWSEDRTYRAADFSVNQGELDNDKSYPKREWECQEGVSSVAGCARAGVSKLS